MRTEADINAAYASACGTRSALNDDATKRLDLDEEGVIAAASRNATEGSLPMFQKMLSLDVPLEVAFVAAAQAAFLCGVMTGVELERTVPA